MAPKRILQVGDQAPSVKLETDEGNVLQLADFLGQTVVLYFYPKDLTPGCTQQACHFQEDLRSLRKQKVQVLGVSKDSVETHQKFKKKFGLQFPLLSDSKGVACLAYGVWKEKSMYGRKYMGIERTTFIIGPNGKIQRIFPKVKVASHSEEVQSALAELKKQE